MRTILVLLLSCLAAPAFAGYPQHCTAPVAVPYVRKQVNVQYAQAFVSFVPSQVLLNGQVVTYGNAGIGTNSIGYSYQGATVAPPQQQAQNPQDSVEARITRIEQALDRFLRSLPQQQQGNPFNVIGSE